MRVEGGIANNMASWGGGGTAEKISCVKGGRSLKKLPLSLVVTASVIMQTSVPECQKYRFR